MTGGRSGATAVRDLASRNTARRRVATAPVSEAAGGRDEVPPERPGGNGSGKPPVDVVLEALSCPVLVVDAEAGSVAYANRAARELFGAQIESLGSRLATLAQASEPPGEVDVEATTGLRTLKVRLDRIAAPSPGGTSSLLVTLEDITERKAASRLREDFLAVVSHELRTPLTTLKLYIQSAQRLLASAPDAEAPEACGERTAKLHDRLNRVDQHAERLSELVSTMLDFARMRTAQVQLAPVALDPAEVARTVLSDLRDDVARAGMAVHLEAPAQLRRGLWDRQRLSQVMSHLLLNALKYGQGRPVVLRLQERATGLRIQVEDRGIGIAPEAQTRIFDCFERASSPFNYGGLGLGLWIVRELVTAMGGRVCVVSRPGEGATFTVDLPAG